MQSWWVFGIGFIAQLLFSARFIFQWLASERAKSVVVPTTFWSYSLTGSIIMLVYGILRSDLAIVVGQCLTYGIYCRNLKLQSVWERVSIQLRWGIVLTPLILITIFICSFQSTKFTSEDQWNISSGLTIVGILAQLIFLFRFVFQWLYSEVQKSSKLPIGFWILSLVGALLILIYGLKRQDLVLIVAHSCGMFIYFRNIELLNRSSQ